MSNMRVPLPPNRCDRAEFRTENVKAAAVPLEQAPSHTFATCRSEKAQNHHNQTDEIHGASSEQRRASGRGRTGAAVASRTSLAAMVKMIVKVNKHTNSKKSAFFFFSQITTDFHDAWNSEVDGQGRRIRCPWTPRTFPAGGSGRRCLGVSHKEDHRAVSRVRRALPEERPQGLLMAENGRARSDRARRRMTAAMACATASRLCRWAQGRRSEDRVCCWGKKQAHKTPTVSLSSLFSFSPLDADPLFLSHAGVFFLFCLFRYKGKTIMFDCGVHPAKTGVSALPYFDMIDPAEIDILLVRTNTHQTLSFRFSWFSPWR
jgi:hypothetical protein